MASETSDVEAVLCFWNISTIPSLPFIFAYISSELSLRSIFAISDSLISPIGSIFKITMLSISSRDLKESPTFTRCWLSPSLI